MITKIFTHNYRVKAFVIAGICGLVGVAGGVAGAEEEREARIGRGGRPHRRLVGPGHRSGTGV